MSSSVRLTKRSAIRRGIAVGIAMITSIAAMMFTASSAHAALPPSEAGYGSYNMDFYIHLPHYDPRDVVAQLNANFDAYFPLQGCGAHLELGEVCDLRGLPGGAPAPIEVIAIERHGFAFRSLPGHVEGPNRIITFAFGTADFATAGGTPPAPVQIEMEVNAWGPVGAASVAGPFNAVFARPAWQAFANNIETRFPPRPTVCPNCV